MPSEDNPCNDQCAADVAAYFLTLPEAPMDTDSDGITDDLDNCLNTPSSAPVNAEGCAASQLTGNVGNAEGGGAMIWKAQCSFCHGNFANDPDARVKAIDPNNLVKPAEEGLALADYIAVFMPSEDNPCNDQCAADVAAYFLTLEEPASGGDVTKGSELYDGKCMGCHGAERTGGAVDYPVTGSLINSKYSNVDTLIAKIASMSRFGATTTDAEAADIAAFLYTD